MSNAASEKKTSSKSKQAAANNDDDFLIVGPGASAGGIQALKKFFMQAPKDSDMAHVVILHMSPEHESKLAEILQLTSAIPGCVNGQKSSRTMFMVIQPNRSLEMEDRHLARLP